MPQLKTRKFIPLSSEILQELELKNNGENHLLNMFFSNFNANERLSTLIFNSKYLNYRATSEKWLLVQECSFDYNTSETSSNFGVIIHS